MARFLLAMIVGLLLVGELAELAPADDISPPGWRGLPLSTFQEFDFQTNDDNPAGPEDGAVVGDFGDSPPSARMSANMQNFDGISGGWRAVGGDGNIELYIPNWVDTKAVKWFRIQVMSYGEDPTLGPNITGGKGDDEYEGEVNEPENIDFDPPTGFEFFVWDGTFTPNPDWELIDLHVPEDTIIGQIVVDTISLPEPITISGVVIALMSLMAHGRWTRKR